MLRAAAPAQPGIPHNPIPLWGIFQEWRSRLGTAVSGSRLVQLRPPLGDRSDGVDAGHADDGSGAFVPHNELVPLLETGDGADSGTDPGDRVAVDQRQVGATRQIWVGGGVEAEIVQGDSSRVRALGGGVFPVVDAPGAEGVVVHGDAAGRIVVRDVGAEMGVNVDAARPRSRGRGSGDRAERYQQDVPDEGAVVVESDHDAMIAGFDLAHGATEVGTHAGLMLGGEALGDRGAERCLAGDGAAIDEHDRVPSFLQRRRGLSRNDPPAVNDNPCSASEPCQPLADALRIRERVEGAHLPPLHRGPCSEDGVGQQAGPAAGGDDDGVIADPRPRRQTHFPVARINAGDGIGKVLYLWQAERDESRRGRAECDALDEHPSVWGNARFADERGYHPALGGEVAGSRDTGRQGLSRHILPRCAQSGIPRSLDGRLPA